MYDNKHSIGFTSDQANYIANLESRVTILENALMQLASSIYPLQPETQFHGSLGDLFINAQEKDND